MKKNLNFKKIFNLVKFCNVPMLAKEDIFIILFDLFQFINCIFYFFTVNKWLINLNVLIRQGN